ncbi:MAG: four helix bundle protein [Flavobacteriales bacterium]|jgi:four helix bundle protein|nr:four helix bundle protein [Crocinitomicaceae bacterium]NBX80656.1 four helix bundle protein [Flavobacteriales bacterium]NCA21102.1 four helix bundle protein [Crocinitomicaceae bacterium]
MKENLIQQKSFEFALKSIDLYKHLLSRNEFILSKQFFRSATSIGANVIEASAGISKKEFVAKMSIASKEARECYYWLELIEASNFSEIRISELKEESQRLIRILTAIVKTCQTNF